MKKKIFSVLFALVLVLSFSLVTAVPVAAAEIHVGPGESIQATIDTAPSGTIITVAAGVYDEQVVINKSLTLQGVGDTTIIRPSAPDILSHIVVTPWIAGTKNFAGIIAVDSAAGAVAVKNLKVDGVNVDSAPTGSNWVAGIVYSESSGTIDGVTVVNMEMPTSDRTNGIWMSAATATVSVEVMGCTVNNYNRGGIYGFGSTLTVSIHDNIVIGPGELAGDNVPNGIMLLNWVSGKVGPKNTVSNHVYTPPTYAATGISLWDVDGVTVEGNSVTNCELGIALTGYTGSKGNTIQDNKVDGNPRAGIFMETPGTTDNEITGNTITNNAHGIEVMGPLAPTYDSGEEAGPDNVAQFNDIVGNTQYGVVNLNPSVTFDAINNWWDSASGPTHASNVGGTGDSVSDNVAFEPWLNAPIEAGAVDLSATVTAPPPEKIGISVDQTSIGFGSVTPGVASQPRTVKVTNTGTVSENISASLTNISTPDVYTQGLTIDGGLTGVWGATGVASMNDVVPDPELILTVPSGTAPGTYTATLVFWAEAA